MEVPIKEPSHIGIELGEDFSLQLFIRLITR
jgi:hypothetical protein